MFDINNQGFKDQMDTALAEAALITKTYFDKLVKQGFNPVQALSIVIAFQNNFFNGRNKP